MPLTHAQVQHIADLARLELSQEELERYRGQLSAILEYFEQLQAVETGAVPPTASVSTMQSPLREDQPRPGLSLDELFGNAPQAEANQFRVPPVFETGPISH